ncbi:unnamed protein product [Ixodes pacificus]
MRHIARADPFMWPRDNVKQSQTINIANNLLLYIFIPIYIFPPITPTVIYMHIWYYFRHYFNKSDLGFNLTLRDVWNNSDMSFVMASLPATMIIDDPKTGTDNVCRLFAVNLGILFFFCYKGAPAKV